MTKRANMKTFISLFAFFISAISAGLLPDYDKRCDNMLVHAANIDPSTFQDQTNYFDKEVPRNIHQIWFGDMSKMPFEKCISWEKYASQFNYQYKLWSEKDFQSKPYFISEINWGLFIKMLQKKNWWAASDIMRYEILKEFGGVYVDCDFMPPHTETVYVDLSDLISFKGITFFTEHNARHIKTSALFINNGFIITCPMHPLIISATEQIYYNAEHWYHRTKNYDAMFVTGPFFLNKVLSGCFNLVPCTYIKKFNCY